MGGVAVGQAIGRSKGTVVGGGAGDIVLSTAEVFADANVLTQEILLSEQHLPATPDENQSRIGGGNDNHAFIQGAETGTLTARTKRPRKNRGRLVQPPATANGTGVMSNATLTQLGRYRILAELERGGMGIVYKAEDPLLNRIVAIKTIIMTGDTVERAQYEARFHHEARVAGGLNHPNIVTVHDIGRDGQVTYMAMEFVEGVALRELMQAGPVALPFALDIVAQVADGLAFAHERGVVHRDIKPGNIMIVRNRHVKIMDFGIARMRESDVEMQGGAILGSPNYMSPEQVAGQRTDPRSDIFSLGVVLYEMLVGESPFPATQLSELLQQIATLAQRPPSAVQTSLPTMMDLVVGRALEKRIGIRYQSAAELARDLRACAAELGP